MAEDLIALVVELELAELEVIENLLDQLQVVIQFHQEVHLQLQQLQLQHKVIQ